LQKKILQFDETVREKKRKMLIPKNEAQDEGVFFIKQKTTLKSKQQE
jgi:hypothetical protein